MLPRGSSRARGGERLHQQAAAAGARCERSAHGQAGGGGALPRKRALASRHRVAVCRAQGQVSRGVGRPGRLITCWGSERKCSKLCCLQAAEYLPTHPTRSATPGMQHWHIQQQQQAPT